jgi:tol-pal system protein YbgF
VTFAYRVKPWTAALLGAAVLSVFAPLVTQAAEPVERLYLAQVDQATQLQLQTMQNSIRYLQVQMQQLTQIKEALTQAQQHDKEQAVLIEQRLGKIDSALSGSRLLELVSQVETLNAELNKMRGELELMRNRFDKAEKRDKNLFADFNDRLKKLEHVSRGSSGDVEDVAKSTDSATVDDTETGGAAAVATSPSSAVVASEPAVSAPVSTAPQMTPSSTGVAAAAAASAAGSVSAAPSTTVAPSAAPATVTAAVAPSAKPAARDPVAENKLYDEALRQFRGGNYQGAVASFESFADKYPASALAPNAQYWIGVSYFNQRDFAKALQTNQALIKSYPDSAKVPDAMLNIASIYVEQNDYTAARSTLEEVIAKHPTSDAAAKARTRLTLLKK